MMVYSDSVTPGQRPGAPLLEPRAEHAAHDQRAIEEGPQLYGAIKVACEDAVREMIDDRAFVVRPGLISGPGDELDMFGYWPGRFARGGRVLVPEAPNQPIQYIDVRDLATWIVDAAEQNLVGTFDGIGPDQPLTELLGATARAVKTDVELVPATAEQLTEAKVNPWAGPRSLPLWLPSAMYGFTSHDAKPSLDSGLRIRPLTDTITATLEHERALGLHRLRKAGLTSAEEAEILAQL